MAHKITFDEYQKKAHSTAIYPKILVLRNPEDRALCDAIDVDLVDISWIYPLIGMIGELGELANKMKKIIRDDGFEISEEKLKEIDDENGDVLWYKAEFNTSLGLSLNNTAKNNLKKLSSRKIRKKIKGKGDHR